jgi:hypothetical protein
MSRLSPEVKDLIIQMNAERKTEAQICAALNLSRSVVAYHCLYGGRGPTPRVCSLKTPARRFGRAIA